MTLRIELKPRERVFIGDTLLINGDHRASFALKGNAPILREKDILATTEVDSPAKRIYMLVQLMYLERSIAKYQDHYFKFVKDFIVAVPSSYDFIEEINSMILSGALYKAIKAAKKLVEYESELLENAPST